MSEDVRDKKNLGAEDVSELNFIRSPGHYIFRRHYRQGLRSHILEVLDPADVALEKSGVVSDGIKWYPRAKPRKMLRIFRTRFLSHQEAYAELKRVLIVAAYLGPHYYARSNEFLVSYRRAEKYDILLCGMQEYVEGLPLEPWGFLNAERLADNLMRPGVGVRATSEDDRNNLIATIETHAHAFVSGVRKMIAETGHIPDLAGDGNLVLTDDGVIKLVDINNISRISYENTVMVDDKGYPVCDKSVEALYELEKSLGSAAVDMNDRLYRTFLDPARKSAVQELEKEFHRDAVWQQYRAD